MLSGSAMAWGEEDQLMPAWSFVIAGHVGDMLHPLVVSIELCKIQMEMIQNDRTSCMASRWLLADLFYGLRLRSMANWCHSDL